MNKNQKGLTPIILILIVLAIIAGGILAWQYWWVAKEEVKPSPVVPVGSNDSFIKAKIISVKPTPENVFPWRAEIQLLESQDVKGYVNLTKEKVNQTLSVRSKESMKDFKVGEMITGYLSLEGDEREIFYLLREIKKEIDETANWKTYKNEEIGIEFQYPEFFKTPLKDAFWRDVYSGKSINIYFMEEGFGFYASTPDYKAFKEDPFTGDENIILRCPQPFTYDKKGNVCKILEVAGEKAIFENRLYEDECVIGFLSRVYFNNRSDSIYKGLMFTVFLDDVNKKISFPYDCTNEGAQKAYSEAVRQSKNIIEQKDLSERDKEKLKLFYQILSTFRFLE